MVDSFIHVVEQYLTYPVNAKVQDAFSEGLMRVIHEEGLKVLDNPNDYQSEDELNALVYDIYGLSAREREIVEQRYL